MENYEKLKEMLESMNDDFMKFYEKGNNAAGTRVRVAMQKIKGLAQDVRVDISERKKA